MNNTVVVTLLVAAVVRPPERASRGPSHVTSTSISDRTSDGADAGFGTVIALVAVVSAVLAVRVPAEPTATAGGNLGFETVIHERRS
ncbi:hypothetical protein BRD05_07055 [Halobacteriales archaeon QS_9_70_65]|nr:MAG: hypothetical protein BRD05_07055 [Halobacteriales archaeon QS_9_70_65]